MSALSGNPFAVLDKEVDYDETAVNSQESGMIFNSLTVLEVIEKPNDKPNGHEPRPTHHGPKRGHRGGWVGHGRQFDRHSGTHRDSDRRIKSGWETGLENALTTTEEAAPVELDENAVVPPEVVEEEQLPPEPVTKTLDEYLAEKAASKHLPQREIRKIESKELKGVVAHRKNLEEDTKEAIGQKKKSKEVKKVTLDIKQTFSNGNNANTFFRGRGRGRGNFTNARGNGRGRGKYPNQNSRASNNNIPNASDFPILA